MSDRFFIRKGGHELGPFTLGQVQAMVRSGELGPSHQCSRDDRYTWAEVASCPELYGEADRAPPPPPEPSTPPILPPEAEPRRRRRRRYEDGDTAASPPRSSGGAVGLAGFITAIVGALLALPPLFVWALQIEEAYAFIPAAFPVLAVSVTGLVLSVVGLFRQRRAFATAGFVIGTVAGLLGVITCVGWLLTPDPRERWVDEALRVTKFEVELKDREYAKALREYREGSLGRTDEELLTELTLKLMRLARAHGKYVHAAARTPRFRRVFLELERLQLAYEEYRESISVKSAKKPRDAIQEAGEDQTPLKELLDIFDLYRQQKISLETAQAKCREADQ